MTTTPSVHPTSLVQLKLPLLIERAAFLLLLGVAVIFAFEIRTPFWVIENVLVLTNVEALMGLTILCWLTSRLISGQLPHIPSEIGIAAWVWIGILILSTAFAPDHQMKAVYFMGRVLGGLLLGWAAYDLSQTPSRRRWLLVALCIGAVAVAIIGLLEATNIPTILYWLEHFKFSQTRVGDVIRVSSTLSYATIAAMILEMILPIMLTLLVTTNQMGLRILLGVGIVLTIAALVLTLSRAGMLSLMMALMTFIVYGLVTRHGSLTLAAAGAGIILVTFVGIVLAWNPTTALRISTETEASWYRADYDVPITLELRPHEYIQVKVLLTNTSVRTWEAGGVQPFQLGYHLVDENGDSINYDGARTSLPHNVAPGERVELEAVILAPDQAGKYVIEWDMVQEAVSWFSWKGTEVAQTMLIVSGQPAEQQDVFVVAQPTDIQVIAPTPVRFDLWGAAWQMALDHPLLGVGPDNFRWQYGNYTGATEWNTNIHANNLYLEWLSGTGFIGLAAFLWLSATILRICIHSLRRQLLTTDTLLNLGLLASLLTWYVHGLFDAFYEFTPTYVAFWLIVGLSLAFARQEAGNAHRL